MSEMSEVHVPVLSWLITIGNRSDSLPRVSKFTGETHIVRLLNVVHVYAHRRGGKYAHYACPCSREPVVICTAIVYLHMYTWIQIEFHQCGIS